MRLLAIDAGSHATGLAFFEDGDRPTWTRACVAASASWPWARRMRAITWAMREQFEGAGMIVAPPDIIAMEDAVVGKYAKTALIIGQSRGYVLAHLDSLWPDLRVVAISPSKVRAAVGLSAFTRRQASKDGYRRVAMYLGLPPTASEDECDAACVGIAALAQLRFEAAVARGESRMAEG